MTTAPPAEVVPDVECTYPPKNEETDCGAPGIDGNDVVVAGTVVAFVLLLPIVEVIEEVLAF